MGTTFLNGRIIVPGLAATYIFESTNSHRCFESIQGRYSKTFGLKVDHIAKCGINKPHADNNRIERLNGTMRERVKVQRGWKSPTSAIAEGKRINYNYVKPHMALKGNTPAETDGIEVKGKNKWLGLMQESHNNI